MYLGVLFVIVWYKGLLAGAKTKPVILLDERQFSKKAIELQKKRRSIEFSLLSTGS
jgi:hypothetical protein